MTAHLWQCKHPYGCAEGNWYSNDSHFRYRSWAAFEAATATEDHDLNLVWRWDWEPERDEETDEPTGRAGDRLLVFAMWQRKARPVSAEICVTAEDEPLVRAWLLPRWERVRALWAPLPAEALSGPDVRELLEELWQAAWAEGQEYGTQGRVRSPREKAEIARVEAALQGEP